MHKHFKKCEINTEDSGACHVAEVFKNQWSGTFQDSFFKIKDNNVCFKSLIICSTCILIFFKHST